ncbi:MAG: DmsE family decaheme c-type cytochrome, partial [Gammaproteobacteria bacterium]|nr:DmsE family decaheme c-type cytochrome [Gammaproteobacteria bacterium]
MNYSLRLPILLMFVLLLSSQVQNASETPAEKATTEPKAAVKVSPADTTEAGEAKHAFKQANLCEGMAEGDYMGPDVCADCHQDKIETMHASPHGQSVDPRTPFGQKGCETCHGPGALHFENEGNCIISMTGRYGESIKQRNDACLDCHNSGERMHWMSSTHEAENLACVSCHSIHKPNDVIERTSQAEVCYTCHKDIRSQTFRASAHPIRDNKVICSDCHNAHGSAGPSSLKQFSINENCYSCHAEKRGPFLWEHNPASEDCTLCHRVHGSNHQALLNKPGPQLCQQCHATQAAGGGRTHISNMLDFDPA